MLVQESAGVVRAVQKAEQDKNRAPGEKRATRHAVFVRDFGLADLTAAKIFREAPRLKRENDDQRGSGGIGQHASPADCGKRAAGEADIVNQKNADGQKDSAGDEQSRKRFFCLP